MFRNFYVITMEIYIYALLSYTNC